jgi:hypothetical protein
MRDELRVRDGRADARDDELRVRGGRLARLTVEERHDDEQQDDEQQNEE